jgi:hypothetical protein
VVGYALARSLEGTEAERVEEVPAPAVEVIEDNTRRPSTGQGDVPRKVVIAVSSQIAIYGMVS